MSELKKSVFHDEPLLNKESLKVALLILSLIGHLQVESAQTLRFCLAEIRLNYFFKLVEPSFLQVVTGLSNARCLNLFKFINFHSLSHVGVIDVLGSDVVALFADLLLSTDDFVVTGQCSEAEFSKHLVVVVLRDLNHSKKWSWFSFYGWWKIKLSGNKVVLLIEAVLVKNDLVHRFAEIHIDLIQ